MTHTLAAVFCFVTQSLSFSELSTSAFSAWSILWLRRGQHLALLYFLNIHVPHVCSNSKDNKSDSFSPSVLPYSKNFLFLRDLNCHQLRLGFKTYFIPLQGYFFDRSSPLSSFPTMFLTPLLLLIFPPAVTPFLIFYSLRPLFLYPPPSNCLRKRILITNQFILLFLFLCSLRIMTVLLPLIFRGLVDMTWFFTPICTDLLERNTLLPLFPVWNWSTDLNTGIFHSTRATVNPPFQWISTKLILIPTSFYSTSLSPGSILLQLFLESFSTAFFIFFTRILAKSQAFLSSQDLLLYLCIILRTPQGVHCSSAQSFIRPALIYALPERFPFLNVANFAKVKYPHIAAGCLSSRLFFTLRRRIRPCFDTQVHSAFTKESVLPHHARCVLSSSQRPSFPEHFFFHSVLSCYVLLAMLALGDSFPFYSLWFGPWKVARFWDCKVFHHAPIFRKKLYTNYELQSSEISLKRKLGINTTIADFRQRTSLHNKE